VGAYRTPAQIQEPPGETAMQVEPQGLQFRCSTRSDCRMGVDGFLHPGPSNGRLIGSISTFSNSHAQAGPRLQNQVEGVRSPCGTVESTGAHHFTHRFSPPGLPMPSLRLDFDAEVQIMATLRSNMRSRLVFIQVFCSSRRRERLKRSTMPSGFSS